MRASTLGITLLVAVAIAAACGGQQRMDEMIGKRQQIGIWHSEIREWRREAGLELEPQQHDINQMRRGSVEQARAVCPGQPPVTEGCKEVCTLAEHICDNSESICEIAGELGPDDKWAQEKCASAKASCREAKKKCCTKCSQAKKTW